MKIKEVEARVGMTRANIRFYEAEGLILPHRNANGYREYSNQDIDVLKKIKLLRTLHISLEEIKTLHTGECELYEALNRHIRRLEEEKAGIEDSQRICTQMRSDGVRYDNLNAQYYLDRIGKVAEGTTPEFVEDEIPKVKAPWQRYFARSFDLMLYTNLWHLILEYGFHVNVGKMGAWASFFSSLIPLVLMFLVEPVLLQIWGTTPGKWLLGMRVTDIDERKLKMDEAQIRTLIVMWYGMGLNLPIYNLYRKWKSYQICMDGRMQEWEETSIILQKERKPWRIPIFVAVYVVIPLFFAFTTYMAGTPMNRGNLTIQEFSENYNQLSKYHGLAGGELNNHGELNSQGEWQEPPAGVIYINGYVPEPELVIAETDGQVTGVEFSSYLKNNHAWPRDYRDKMVLCVMSYVQAKKECPLFSKEMNEVLDYIQEHPFEDFSLSAYGVTISCEVEYSGYDTGFMDVMKCLIPQEDENGEYKNEYRIRFMMQIEE